MESNYYEVSGRIFLAKDSDLFRCLVAVAEKENVTVDEVAKYVIEVGLSSHMKSNLQLLFRLN